MNLLKKIPLPALSLLLALYLACQPTKPDQTILAKINARPISLAAFKSAYIEYLLEPSHFDSPETRRHFLEMMLEQRLLAHEARKLNLHQDEWLSRLTQSYTNKLTRDQYLQDYVYPQVEQVTEAETRQVYHYLQEERYVRHLFAPTKEKADSLYQFLKTGTSFHDLAADTFQDTALTNRGGLLGWIRWDQMDYDLANGIFQAPLNKFTSPLPSRFGYHIILVENARTNPLVSEYDFQRQQSRTHFLIRNAKISKYLEEWIQDFMSTLDIKLNAPLFPVIAKTLRERLKPKTGPYLPDKMQLSEFEIKSLLNPLEQYRHDPIAWYQGQALTVEQFVTGLFWVPHQITNHSLYDALGYVIRDQHVTNLARQKNLHQHSTVRLKANLFQEALIAKKYRAHLIQSIQIEEAELKEFYYQHIERYRDEPFLKARKIVFPNQALATQFINAIQRDQPHQHLIKGALFDTIQILSSTADSLAFHQTLHLNAGEVTAPVATPGGITVWWLLDKTTRFHPFEEMREFIYQDLLNRKRHRIVPEKTQQLRQQQAVTIYPERLEKIFKWDE